MALRKIAEVVVGRVKVRVYRDPEWNEYVVKNDVGGSYHTDAKDDALRTAQDMATRLAKEDEAHGTT